MSLRSGSLVLMAIIALPTVGAPRGTSAQSYTFTDLGTLGGSFSGANAINDHGQVGGLATIPPTNIPFHAFLWENGTMTDLGTLGGITSQAHGINTRGQVVGSSSISTGTQHAFLWHDGVMLDLDTPTNVASEADVINDAGQIAGTIDQIAFIWEDGVMTELGTLPGFAGSFGHGINQAGEVVGGAFLCHFCEARAFH